MISLCLSSISCLAISSRGLIFDADGGEESSELIGDAVDERGGGLKEGEGGMGVGEEERFEGERALEDRSNEPMGEVDEEGLTS